MSFPLALLASPKKTTSHIAIRLTVLVFEIIQIGLHCLNGLGSLRRIFSKQIALGSAPNINGFFALQNRRHGDTRWIIVRLILLDFATRKNSLHSLRGCVVLLVAPVSVAALYSYDGKA